MDGVYIGEGRVELNRVVRGDMEEGACALQQKVKKVDSQSPAERVIGSAAYYPFSDGGIMKEPPPSIIVAGLKRKEVLDQVVECQKLKLFTYCWAEDR